MAQSAAMAAGSRLGGAIYGAGAGAGAFVLFNNADGVKAYTGELARMTLHFLTRPAYGYPGAPGGGNYGSNGGGNNSNAIAPLAERLDQLALEMSRIRQGQSFSAMIGGPPSMTTTIIVVGTTGVILYIAGVRGFEDVIYVTKKHFNTTIEALKEGVSGLASALARVRGELLEKVGIVETKVDETRVALEGKIDGVHQEIKGVAESQDLMEGLIRGLEDKLLLTQEQIQQANHGIVVLCNVVAESGVDNRELLAFTQKYGAPALAKSSSSKAAPVASASASASSDKPGATISVAPRQQEKTDFSINDILLREGLQHLISMTSGGKHSQRDGSVDFPTAVPIERDFSTVLSGLAAIAPNGKPASF